MGIKSELHEAILKRGGTVPPYGGIAAAMDELNKLPGGSGVSDWDDLKNRPFGTEKGETVLPETTVTFDAESGEGAIADVVPIVVGNSYTVYWNGTEYPCVAGSFNMDGVPLATLGNLGAMTGAGVTDEPFLLLALPADIAAEMGMGAMCLALDGSTSATVSIQNVIVHPLPSMYLPRMDVTFTLRQEAYRKGVADKTFGEVLAAIESGTIVTGLVKDSSGITYRLPVVTVGSHGVGLAMNVADLIFISISYIADPDADNGNPVSFTYKGVTIPVAE